MSTATGAIRIEPRGKTQAKEVLDKLASNLLQYLTMRAPALVTAMSARMKHDEAELGRLERELGKLAPGYHKYVDLMAQIKTHERSIERLKAIIGYGAAPFGTLLYTQPESPDDMEAQREGQELRRGLELWETVEEYLRFVPEARVKEILDFMRLVNIRSSRQAIEAAVNAHGERFKIRKNGREKFISLKQ